MSHVLVGKVDNGEIVEVALGFYSGRAAVRRSGAGGELSYAGEMPFVMFPAQGKIDGEPVEITAIRKSEPSPGMLVAAFRILG